MGNGYSLAMQSSAVPGVEKYLGSDLLRRRWQLWRGVQTNLCVIPKSQMYKSTKYCGLMMTLK